MTRLHDEFLRLFVPSPDAAPGAVRVLVLELVAPADWATLAAVWRGVQADLAWPAPAIAVNGRDALQLWFSLGEPVSAAAGRAGLEALCARYLPGVPPRRVCLLCGVAASAQAHDQGQAERVPAAQAAPDQWSAFVAQDLAPIFEDTPWLDIPPNEEGQAQLLAGLKSLTSAQWASWCRIEEPGAPVTARAPALSATQASPQPPPDGVAVDADDDPRAFLLRVMKDPAQPMALRVEAAKALLR